MALDTLPFVLGDCQLAPCRRDVVDGLPFRNVFVFNCIIYDDCETLLCMVGLATWAFVTKLLFYRDLIFQWLDFV